MRETQRKKKPLVFTYLGSDSIELVEWFTSSRGAVRNVLNGV